MEHHWFLLPDTSSLGARHTRRALGTSEQKGKKENMSKFEKFVVEGDEKADDLAKTGAVLDERFMADARARTMQQEREDAYAALQYAACFHCLVEHWKDCEELRPKPKEKWVFV